MKSLSTYNRCDTLWYLKELRMYRQRVGYAYKRWTIIKQIIPKKKKS